MFPFLCTLFIFYKNIVFFPDEAKCFYFSAPHDIFAFPCIWSLVNFSHDQPASIIYSLTQLASYDITHKLLGEMLLASKTRQMLL